MVVSCPECHGQVSTHAISCPHCGYKLSSRDVNRGVRVPCEVCDEGEVCDFMDVELYKVQSSKFLIGGTQTSYQKRTEKVGVCSKCKNRIETEGLIVGIPALIAMIWAVYKVFQINEVWWQGLLVSLFAAPMAGGFVVFVIGLIVKGDKRLRKTCRIQALLNEGWQIGSKPDKMDALNHAK